MAIRLDAACRAAINAHGRETYPNECCGVMYGAAGHVTAVLALPNTTEEGPRRRFRVSDRDYMAAEKKATELRADMLGFYHSHPDHPARPSQYDLDHAWPNMSYVIVSVSAGEPGELRSFVLRDDRSQFDEEPVEE